MWLSKKFHSDVKLQVRNNDLTTKVPYKHRGKCIENDKRYYEENKESFEGRSRSEEEKNRKASILEIGIEIYLKKTKKKESGKEYLQTYVWKRQTKKERTHERILERIYRKSDPTMQ